MPAVIYWVAAIAVIFWVYSIIDSIRSQKEDKIVWIVLTIILPVLGGIVYLFMAGDSQFRQQLTRQWHLLINAANCPMLVWQPAGKTRPCDCFSMAAYFCTSSGPPKRSILILVF